MPRPHCEQSYTNFLKSFSQRIYLSYRKQFEPLNGLTRSGDSITSDCGWGCMIRCAQMLLAQTLLIHMTNPINLPHSNIQISDKCTCRKEEKKYFTFFFFKVQNEIQLNVFEIPTELIDEHKFYTDIIRLFGDHPNVKCPFGIHK